MTHLFLVSMIDSISGVDTLWVLLGAMLVFWMQPGFALVEAGMTRSKNTANILMKNFCDFMCGSVLFWIIGFSLMFGTDHGFVACILYFPDHVLRHGGYDCEWCHG